jgi:hypothetical protein
VPLQKALDAMVSDSKVTFTTITVPAWSANPNGYTYNPDYYYEFSPASGSPTEALIIYPGGCVDPGAYAPLAHDIAAAGYLVALVPIPEYLSIYGEDRAEAVISNHPAIEKWSISGHSFGGVGACWYVENKAGTYMNASKINGLILWASYPADNVYLNTYPIKAISIWGTNDGGMDITDINNSKDNLPPDTRFVALQGANHSQFGWYGESATDNDFVQPTDNPADITREEQTDLIVNYTLSFLDSLTPSVPAALETITAEDGSVWERVSEPGFGDKYNTGVVALCPFQGSLYAINRNDNSGFELWKTSGTGWERLTVPGFTDDNKYYGFSIPYGGTTALRFNLKQNVWCAMKEFNGYLYVTVSTGYQGSNLYGSIGFEIWRFDGVTWEPVIGNAAVSEKTGTITGISGCDDNDGDTTAQITDSAKNWTVDQWKGCVLRVHGAFDGTITGTVPGTPGIKMFKITENTSNTLTIQEDEVANKTQYTICAEHEAAADPGRATNVVPAIEVGSSYAIESGTQERGFGELWNKSVVDLAILNDELYLSIALSYENGARIWKTSDGTTWTPSSSYSFGLFHGYYPGYPPTDLTGFCLDEGLESRNGQPVCSSVTHLGKSSVTGVETLFTGGTGTSGCNGKGARAAFLNPNTNNWETIVDYFVDTDTDGTNENGFGDNGGSVGFTAANFQAWSWAEYDNHLFVGIARFVGGRVMYTKTGLTDIKANDAWVYSVGGDPSLPGGGYATAPDGFDGAGGAAGYGANGGANLFVHNNTLYAGTFVTNGFKVEGDPPIDGADIWKGTGPADNLTWTRVTGDGFGDPNVLQFEAFTTFSDAMYVAANNSADSDFPGDTPAGFTGAKIYRMASKYSISGTVTLNGSGLSGVTITLSGDSSDITTTDSSGNYIFSSVSNGTYEVTPSKSGYAFTPPNRAVTINGADVTGVDFVAKSKLCAAEMLLNNRKKARPDDSQSKLGVLRLFRDNVLNQSQEGKELTKLYYQHSPEIIRIMDENPALMGKTLLLFLIN